MKWLSMILAGVLLAASAPRVAGQSSPDLRGIYVDSNAFPISQTNATALLQSLNASGVDGVTLVFGWSGIEPSMGQFDWSTR